MGLPASLSLQRGESACAYSLPCESAVKADFVAKRAGLSGLNERFHYIIIQALFVVVMTIHDAAALDGIT